MEDNHKGSIFSDFAVKLMRVSKGRPIGASAADKVLEDACADSEPKL